MKKFFVVLVTLLCIGIAFAIPRNNSVQQQSSWNGWGGNVDWSFRSLRVGSLLEDSLLEDGWIIVDTIGVSVLTADSIFISTLGADTLYAVYANIDTLVVDNFAAIDTIIFTSRVPRDTLANRRIGMLADSVYAQSQAVGVVYGTAGGTWVQQLSAYVRVEPGDTASVYWSVYAGAPMDSVLLPESPGSYLMPRGLSDTLLVVDTVWTKYNWTLPNPVYLHLPLSYAFYAAGNIDWWLAGMNHDAAPVTGEVIYGMEFVPFPTLAWQTNGIDPIVQFMCDSTVRQDSMVCAYDPRDRRYSMYLDEASAYLFQTRVLGTDYLFSPSGTWVTNLSNFISYGTNLMGLITADSIATTDLRVLDDAVVDSMLAVGDSAYFNDQVHIDGTLSCNDISVADSLTVTTAADLPSSVLLGGGRIYNPTNIMRLVPVLNKGYLSFDNSTSTLTIRQDSTLAAGSNNIVLAAKEEDGTNHDLLYWADTSGAVASGETWQFTANSTFFGVSPIRVGYVGTSDVTQTIAGLRYARMLADGGYNFNIGHSSGTGALLFGWNALATINPTHVLGNLATGLFNCAQSPDFAASTGWTLTNATISGGKLNKLTAAGAGSGAQTATILPVVSGVTYLIHVDVDSLSTGHSILLTMGGTTFGTITAEGQDQWFRGTTVNSSEALTLAWDDGETGIVDDVYVYRLSGNLQVGGEVWNQTWLIDTTYTVQSGDHVLTLNNADTCTITLPALSASWDALTSTGREIVFENSGSGFWIIQVDAGDVAFNAIAGDDSLHLAQYETAILRAVTSQHWALQR